MSAGIQHYLFCSGGDDPANVETEILYEEECEEEVETTDEEAGPQRNKLTWNYNRDLTFKYKNTPTVQNPDPQVEPHVDESSDPMAVKKVLVLAADLCDSSIFELLLTHPTYHVSMWAGSSLVAFRRNLVSNSGRTI